MMKMIKVGDVVKVNNNSDNDIKQLGLENCVGTVHEVTYVWTDQNKQLFCTVEDETEIPMNCLERI